MPSDLVDLIQSAVKEGRKARSAYYANIVLEDEQELGGPAPEAQLVNIENRVGRRLPPSYRTFLSLYNGWRMISGAIDLLSIEEMLGGPRAEQVHKWQQEAVRNDYEAITVRSLVIGLGEITATRILLDPETIGPDGEWALVLYDRGEAEEYSSFIEWLEASVAIFRDMVEHPEDYQ
jgi:SMI1 / KNR4 family (SUKH-1)